MSAANGSAVPGETVTESKGKGKAVDQAQAQSHDMSMDEDEDSSEESGNEEPVSSHLVDVFTLLRAISR
jgi:hypothetical protein